MEFRQPRCVPVTQRARPTSATTCVPHVAGGAVPIGVCIEAAAVIRKIPTHLDAKAAAPEAVYVLAAISAGKFQFVRESRERNEDRWLEY